MSEREPTEPAPAEKARPDAPAPARDEPASAPAEAQAAQAERPAPTVPGGERGRHAIARRPVHPPVRHQPAPPESAREEAARPEPPAPRRPSGLPAGTISAARRQPPAEARPAPPASARPQPAPAVPSVPRPSPPDRAERPADAEAPVVLPTQQGERERPRAAEDPAPPAEPTPAPPADTASAVTSEAPPPRSGENARARLAAVLWPPRLSRGQTLVALLLAVLGAALAIQVRSGGEDSQLRNARQSDLVRLLDDVNDRAARLTDEQRRLEASQATLQSSSDRSKAALEQAQQRTAALEVLAGTAKASGPGVTLTVLDPQRGVKGAQLLDALQELRNAGAEAVQVNSVRVVAATAFVDGPTAGQIVVDGQTVSPPYVIKAIGDPHGIDTALHIPGGVIAVLQEKGAQATVTESQQVLVDAVREPGQPRYSRPAAGAQ